jgi:hypothetical protein
MINVGSTSSEIKDAIFVEHEIVCLRIDSDSNWNLSDTSLELGHTIFINDSHTGSVSSPLKVIFSAC